MDIEQLKLKKGEVRGMALKTDFNYLKIQNLNFNLPQNILKEWGVDLDYRKIKNFRWYPVYFRPLSLLAILKAFNFSDEKVFEIGYLAPTFSVFFKVFMKYFSSLKTTYKLAPRYWDYFYTIGRLNNPEFNEKEKFLVLEIEEFDLHPILCLYFQGYFLKLTELASNFKNLKVEEKKCSFKGSLAHQFIISWA